MQPSAPERESSVVEAATHAKAPTVMIHSHERDDDHVEPSRAERSSVAVRNGDAVNPAAGFPRQWQEAQAAVPLVDDDGRVKPDAAACSGGEEGGRVRFAVERQIDRNARTAFERSLAQDGGGGPVRTPPVFGGGERAARAAHFSPERGFHGEVSWCGRPFSRGPHAWRDGATRKCRFRPMLPT